MPSWSAPGCSSRPRRPSSTPGRRPGGRRRRRRGRAGQATAISRLAPQLHGAIGYVTEPDLDLFSRRATAVALAAGTASRHLTALARPYTGGPPCTLGLDGLDTTDDSLPDDTAPPAGGSKNR
ncbi:hypothetical protein L3X23_18830 [Pseudonocardia sp. WMMC193]|nr:hypothetical protein [Pseudonocardia sp. WMMC193]MCF7550827.1 hypothetical protein [Pseudonocardia sp. WMMC193]